MRSNNNSNNNLFKARFGVERRHRGLQCRRCLRCGDGRDVALLQILRSGLIGAIAARPMDTTVEMDQTNSLYQSLLAKPSVIKLSALVTLFNSIINLCALVTLSNLLIF